MPTASPWNCTVPRQRPTAAYVFKTVADPFVGKLSYLRVVSGKVTAGEPLVNARTGEPEKIGKPLTVIGKKQVDADGIGAGDIGAVAKLVTARTGDTLCDAFPRGEAARPRVPAAQPVHGSHRGQKGR